MHTHTHTHIHTYTHTQTHTHVSLQKYPFNVDFMAGDFLETDSQKQYDVVTWCVSVCFCEWMSACGDVCMGAVYVDVCGGVGVSRIRVRVCVCVAVTVE